MNNTQAATAFALEMNRSICWTLLLNKAALREMKKNMTVLKA